MDLKIVDFGTFSSNSSVVRSSFSRLLPLCAIVNKRFMDEKYKSPGPCAPSLSSMGKQVSSHRPSAGSINFGTSSRDGALKLYAIYTTK